MSFKNFLKAKRTKITAFSLLALSLVSVAIAVPVVLTAPSRQTDATATEEPVREPEPEPEPVIPKQLLIVASGQSNMMGVIYSDPKNINSYRFSDKTPVIYTAYNGSTPANKAASIFAQPVTLKSAGDSYGGFSIVKGIAFKQAETMKYSKIWVVNSAVGGVGFKNPELANLPPKSLNPLGRAYQLDMIRQGIELNPELKTSLSNGTVEIVMTWLQGESDADHVKNDTDADQYADMVVSYLSTIRELLPVTPETVVPIIVGAMEPSWAVGVGTVFEPIQRQLVQQAIATIPGKLEHSAYVNSTGLPVNSREFDWVHYGLTQLGPMADRYIQAIPFAIANGAPKRLPLRSIDNRIFGQFTTNPGPEWGEFESASFHTAVSFNRMLANQKDGYLPNVNFSNLSRLYGYKSEDPDPKKRYRIRLRLYAGPKFATLVEIYFVTSINFTFYSAFNQPSANDFFEIEQVKTYGVNQPAFLKEEVDINPVRVIGIDPNAWSVGKYAAVYTMSSGATEITFPQAGTRTAPLGKFSNKAKTLSWDFDHITLDAVAFGLS